MSLITCKITSAFGPAAPTKHSLMGIRYLDGEGGAIPPVVTPPVVTPPADVKPPWGDDPTKFDPDKAWKLIQNIKGDLDSEKERRATEIAAAVKKASEDTQKATLAQFGKLLSGEAEPETDPVKLAAKVTELSTAVSEKDTSLTKAQADILAGKLATAVAIQAHGLGGSPKLLLANQEFMTSIASVDPADEAAITAKITAAIQANAALKATPSSSGGSEHQGGQTQALDAQIAAAEKAGDQQSVISLQRAKYRVLHQNI